MNENDYTSYRATDFLLDEKFCLWMKTDDPELGKFWNGWLEKNRHQKKELENAKKLYAALQFRQEKISKQAIEEEWQKLQAIAIPDSIGYEHRTGNRGSRFNWLTAASVSLLVMACAGYFYLSKGTSSTDKTLVTNVAPKGRRMQITLKDGTKVHLNSGSSISYPEDFAHDKRSVTLQGEAFFDVTPNPQVPFVIKSGEVTTEVVGTSFGIAAYPGNSDVRVAVVSGKVNVYSAESSKQDVKLTLIPNQMATFENQHRVFAVSPFDQEKQLAWVNGTLYFEKADFKDVVSKLENWYGVTILTAPGVNPSKDLLLTGKFKNKTLLYVLDSYSYPDRFSYTIKNDTITIQ